MRDWENFNNSQLMLFAFLCYSGKLKTLYLFCFSDVLDLQLHEEDGIDFADDTDGCSSQNKVRLRAGAVSHAIEKSETHPNTDSYEHQVPENYDERENDQYNRYDDSADYDDDDDDDNDSKSTRARFRRERNTESIQSGQTSSCGKPIQTLGIVLHRLKSVIKNIETELKCII